MLNLFHIFTFTQETFYGSVVLKLTKWDYYKNSVNKAILLLVIYSNGNFVCRQLPELQNGYVHQLLGAKRTQRPGGLADLLIFRILTNIWGVEVSVPLDRGSDVSFQEITPWFSENWYQELAQRGIDQFILYDLANCSLLAIFIIQIKRREEKVEPLSQRMDRLFLSAGLAVLLPSSSLPSLEVCVEADGGQEDGERKSQQKISSDGGPLRELECGGRRRLPWLDIRRLARQEYC